MLHRILTAVEKGRSRGRLELLIAVILSLATLSSTWCGYQAQRWGSAASSAGADADTAERQAAETTIVALQLRTFDGIAILEYWNAMRTDDDARRQTIFARLRPTLQRAIEASVAAGVLTDPTVAGPLQRPEYVLPEEQAARRLREQADLSKSAARAASKSAGAYVLLTLMFASVLFFGGIAGTLTSRAVRIGLGVVALVLFLVTISMLIGLPVAGSN